MLDTCLTEDEMTLNYLNIVPGHVQKSAFTLPRWRGVEKEQEKVEDHRVLQTKVHHNFIDHLLQRRKILLSKSILGL